MNETCQVRCIRCGNVNCYLLEGLGGAVLVDTGREAHRQRVLDACRGAGVTLLVLTHGHVDHVQNAAFLAQALGVPIAMSRTDAPLAADNLSRPLEARGLVGRAVLAASVRSFRRDKIPPFTPSVWLKEGDRLDPYGVPAKVLELPGHTMGSIGLDLAESHLLAGDALMHMTAPGLSLLYEDQAALIESGKRITALGDRTIWFGHGKPVRNREWNR